MARKTLASGARVREFLRSTGVEVGSRGRFSAEQIAAFEQATGEKYAVGHKDEQRVTLSVPTVDKAGRKRTRKVEKPLSEVRTLAGEAAGERGVLSAKAVEAAGLALAEQMKASK